MDYKDTLNLPKTDFPMKADLPKREPLFLENWQKQDIYRLIRKNSQGKPRYILHDGPPYANGDIHIGHALNKTLKDIVVKYKTMRGMDSAYVPGWDCHGLPIEHALFKELKIAKHQIAQVEFRKRAHDYAMRFVDLQREQFKRLGVFGDWENPYLTLSRDYEESIISSFGRLVDDGYIYRGLKPVNWCFRCETALAEAEVEYENHSSPSVFVKFRITGQLKGFGESGSGDAFLVIWTTTPWTLLANVAVALHPDFAYSFVKTEKGNLIIATVLMPSVLEKSNIQNYQVIAEASGKELQGITYEHPFGLRNGIVVLADYVSQEEGTGLVHTAPGHGSEDYITGVRNKLEIIMPVDSRGNFDSSAGEFTGKNVLDANKEIMDKLESLGSLLYKSRIDHSYPHCWRCKNPIIFRATRQWFLDIGHKELRSRLLKAINQDVKWIPASGSQRIAAMVEARPDWCLSRQRYWGVPIPSVICQECGEELLWLPLIERFKDYVEQEGSDCWFSRPIEDFVPDGFNCPKCANAKFKKGSDILDVWFDSGVSHQAVLKKRDELGRQIPCQLYLEGTDQHRGWFQSSLIPSIALDGKPAFESVLTHGFVVDGEGRKMSKSLGNVIKPQDIIKDYGADILRMWVASSDYNGDIRISKEMLARLSEAYRKIRNTAKFILSNLYDFGPDTDKVAYENLKKIDKRYLYLLNRKLLGMATDAYENFEFHKAYKAIYDFCNEELSMDYLDMAKGRLYTSGAASVERRAVQTVLYEILRVLVRVSGPILVFTAEEIWQCMPKEKENKHTLSVHLSDWPKVDMEFWRNKLNFPDDNHENPLILDEAVKLRPEVNKILEEKRSAGVIGSSFDAKINLLTNNQIRYKYLDSLKEDLCEIFKVSQVCVFRQDPLPDAVIRSTACSDTGIEVIKAEGEKCMRCWNYSSQVGKDIVHPDLCEKCAKSISGSCIEKGKA